MQKEIQELKIIKRIPTPTKDTLDLKIALEKRGVHVLLEYYDGHKHVDISIPEAKLDIEVDGIQHLTKPAQIPADLHRGYYSHKSGFDTIHIQNEMIREHLGVIADALAEAVKMKEKMLHVHVE